MNRREVLGIGVVGGFLGATGLSAQILSTPKNADLKVYISLNGGSYSYPDGLKLPSYDVAFREDGRVVFHYGTLWEGAPNNLGLHHVKILNGSTVLFDADIPEHFWHSEWTWRPAPIKVLRTPAKIVEDRFMFPFGNPGVKVGRVNKYVFTGPMDSAGITKYMPTTGERPDIGLITDPSAYFMLTWDASIMLAWAQAAGSVPMHYRDERTGKPIDLLKYPQTNNYDIQGRQGEPWFQRGPNNTPGGNWGPDTSHWPEMSYMAYIATGDLGFLEDLQCAANYTIFSDAYYSNPTDGARFGIGQTRQIAWALRNLFMAHVATKDAEARNELPASCHGSDYWKALLDHALAFLTPYMNDPSLQVFRLIGPNTNFGPWQVDYLMTVLNFAVLTGHSEWTDLYLWALGNPIARTNGKSGYPPGYGTAYYLRTAPAGIDSNAPNGIPPAQRFSSWRVAFDALSASSNSGLTQKNIDALKADQFNNGVPVTGREYLMTTRAVLAMALNLEKLGIVPVTEKYPEFPACFATVQRMIKNLDSDPGWSMNLRCAVIA